MYNHFARATKGYLDVVARASGAVGRLLSRDLDRTQAPYAAVPRRSDAMGASFADLDSEDEFEESHEINVTPFIDVMLVCSSSSWWRRRFSTVDLPIDLPTSTATPQKKPDKPTYVTIKADLAVAIGKRRSSVSIWCTRDRRRRRQGSTPVPARRQGGAVWRADERSRDFRGGAT